MVRDWNDWKQAYIHLDAIKEKILDDVWNGKRDLYYELGPINQLVLRHHQGERTEELYQEMITFKI